MKKLISTIVVLLIVSITTLANQNFKDVTSNQWFYKNLQTALSKGMVSGYPDGTFKPNGNVSSSEFLAIVVRDIAPSEIEIARAQLVNPSWDEPVIKAAQKIGLVRTGEINNFRAPMTREQMALVSARGVAYKESLSNIDSKLNHQGEIRKYITDFNTSNSSTTVRSAIEAVYELGVISGYPDGTFKPKGNLTRAECLVVALRISDPSLRTPFNMEEAQKKIESKYKTVYEKGYKGVDPSIIGVEKYGGLQQVVFIKASDLPLKINDWSTAIGNVRIDGNFIIVRWELSNGNNRCPDIAFANTNGGGGDSRNTVKQVELGNGLVDGYYTLKNGMAPNFNINDYEYIGFRDVMNRSYIFIPRTDLLK